MRKILIQVVPHFRYIFSCISKSMDIAMIHIKQTALTLRNAAIVATAVFALAACQKKEATAPVQTPDVAGPNGAAIDPHAGLKSESATAPAAVPETGPAEGGTAIGGMVAGQDADSNKPRDSGASEPTGGDGATTQAATPPAK
ncbi:hypothetical protein [Massilia aurea]|uniref:hypothetical protein n=2 Tax=Massilia aurea TaxID=373040 RepID=UPI0031DB52C1